MISRSLACMRGIALLSEVHPAGISIINPFAQAMEWHGLPGEERLRRLFRHGTASFPEAMGAILEAAEERGLALVLREWSHLDFIGMPPLAWPTGRSMLAEILGAYELVRIATVRHPLDQWLSFQETGNLVTVPLDHFLRACRRFAESVQEIGFLRYEDFCRAPETFMQELCRRLQLPYDPTFLERQADWQNITGDRRGTVGRDPGRIAVLPRRKVTPEMLAEIESSPDYRATLDLLGYQPAESRAAAAS